MKIEELMCATGAEVAVAGQVVAASEEGAEGMALFPEAAGLDPEAVVSVGGGVGHPTQLAAEVSQHLNGPDGLVGSRSH